VQPRVVVALVTPADEEQLTVTRTAELASSSLPLRSLTKMIFFAISCLHLIG